MGNFLLKSIVLGAACLSQQKGPLYHKQGCRGKWLSEYMWESGEPSYRNTLRCVDAGTDKLMARTILLTRTFSMANSHSERINEGEPLASREPKFLF